MRIPQRVRVGRRQRFLGAAWRWVTRKGSTVDELGTEAGPGNGAFFGYFHGRQALLVALLEAEAVAVDRRMDELARRVPGALERVAPFVRSMLELGDDPAQAQVRADLWNVVATEPVVRDCLVRTTERRRATLRAWIEGGVRSDELVEIPANAFACVLLALGDGLLLHSALQPEALRWPDIRRAVDVLLEGITLATEGPTAA